MASANKRGGNDPFVKCMFCKNAGAYYQWQQNPVIAQCKITKERQVALTKRICKFYAPSESENPEIKHFESYDEQPEDL